MKRRKMDYEKIMIICGIITLIMGGVTIWARIQKNNETKGQKRIEDEEKIQFKNEVDNKFVKVRDELKELRDIVLDKREISLNYDALTPDEQNQLLRDKFNYSSDELIALIFKAKQRTDSYVSNALAFDFENDNLNAIKYYNKALKETALNEQKAWILFSIGNQYFNLQNDKEAIRYYNLSIDFYDKLDKKSGDDLVTIGYVYNGLGMINRKNGNYIKAIENHEKALRIREDLVSKNRNKHILELSMSYNNLAIVYKNQGNFSKSLEYNLLALNIREELAEQTGLVIDKFYLARTLSNLGNAYSSKGEYANAKTQLEKSINLLKTLDGKMKHNLYEISLAGFLVNYGDCLNQLKDYKSSISPLEIAISYFEKYLKEDESVDIELYVAATYNLSVAYKNTGNFKESIKMLQEIIVIQSKIVVLRNTSIDAEIHLADVYYSIALVYYENIPNKKLALDNFGKAYNIYDKYPQSAHARKWAKEAKDRIDKLTGI